MALRELCIHLTRQCNLRCAHCYCNAGSEHKEYMNTDMIFMALEQAKNANVVRITIQGGEPFLYSGLKEVCKKACEMGFMVAIPTNGQFINDENAKWIKKYVDIIYISIHGLEGFHDKFVSKKGAYSRAIESIRVCINNNIRFGILTSVSRDNIKDIPVFLAELDKIGVPLVGILEHSEVGRGKNISSLGIKEWEEFYHNINKIQLNMKVRFESTVRNIDSKVTISCLGMEKKICFLDVNGDIYFCSLLMDNPQYKFGNIETLSIDKYFQLIGWEWVDKHVTKMKKCLNCNKKEQCQGGCVAMRIRLKECECGNSDPYVPKCVLYPDIDVYEKILEGGM